MSKPTALLLLALAFFACAYMRRQHEPLVSLWWWFWQVPGTVATIWIGWFICDIWWDARAGDDDELEEIMELENEQLDD